MNELLIQLEGQRDYLKTVIADLKVNIEICCKIGYSLQARKFTDEKDIYIEFKDYLEHLIKKYKTT